MITVVAHIAVVIFAGIGNIFGEPFRRCKAVRFIFRRKFHFCKDQRSKFSLKNIQFDGIGTKWNTISLFCDKQTVCFRAEMFVTLCGQRKIVFFSCHETTGFVGEKISIILFADAHNRIGTQIALFNVAAWILFQMFR